MYQTDPYIIMLRIYWYHMQIWFIKIKIKIKITCKIWLCCWSKKLAMIVIRVTCDAWWIPSLFSLTYPNPKTGPTRAFISLTNNPVAQIIRNNLFPPWFFGFLTQSTVDHLLHPRHLFSRNLHRIRVPIKKTP